MVKSNPRSKLPMARYLQSHLQTQRFIIILHCLPVFFTLAACQIVFPIITTSPDGTPNPDNTKQPTTPIPIQLNSTITATQSSPSSKLTIAPSEMRGISLQFWHPWTGEEGNLIAELADEFNLSNEWKIQIHPKYKGSLDELSEQVSSAINTTGQIPDLVVGYTYQAQNWNTARPIVLDLHSFLEDPVWGMTKETVEAIYPVFRDSDLVGGKRWGFPALRSGEILFYNVSWAKELGFNSPPSTPQHFLDQACTATKANLKDVNKVNDGSGGWLITNDFSTVLTWMNAFGSKILKAEKNGYQFNTPEVSNTFEFLRKMYEDKCSWIPESDFPGDEFANRRGIVLSGSTSDIPYLAKRFTQAGNPDAWTALTFPVNSGNPVIDVYGPAYVIFRSSPPRELAAWLFVKWLSSPENHARLAKAGYTLPLSKNEASVIRSMVGINTTWVTTFDYISLAVPEPSLQSWQQVRWAVSDASRQLYQWYFKADQVPNLVRLLNETANDLNSHAP
jgi:multiple sugar transport system substrate-binding protein